MYSRIRSSWNLYDLNQKPKILQNPGVNNIIINSNETNRILENAITKILDLTVLDELDNLTAQQISFMIWLYKNKTYKPGDSINITTPLQLIYGSLPNNIKNNLRNKLPIIQALESFKSPFVIKHYE